MAIIIDIITWPKMASPEMGYHATHVIEPFRASVKAHKVALTKAEVSLGWCEISHDPVMHPI